MTSESDSKPKSKAGITEQDYQAAAAELGVEVATIKAVAEVETRGAGFLASGEPVILFERHIFHRLTQGRYSARHPAISNRTPGGYGAAGAHQHRRLQQATAIDREAALQSASWGRFQVMGFNWKVAGYRNLQSFINAAYRSEGDHLDMFVGFIKSNRLDRELRAHDWRGFARKYNGPGYASNDYHNKMQRAYNKYKQQENKKEEVDEGGKSC